MNKKPDKYIIGLTGNIASGKSLVLKMLGELGAYTIDADTISHRVILSDGPAFQPVLDAFGKWLLDEKGEIDRAKLGKLVFSDPAALSLLESIVHPAVEEAVDALLNHCQPEVVAIEAIKLLEGGIGSICDAIWVVDAPREVQIRRLINQRGLMPQQAAERVNLQGDNGDKLTKADVVIHNDSSPANTWDQIAAAWGEIDPPSVRVPDITDPLSPVRRVMPTDLHRLSEFLGDIPNLDELAYLTHFTRAQISGAVGWYSENFIGHLADLKVDSTLNAELALRRMINVVELAATTMKNEVLFVYPASDLPSAADVLKELGYLHKQPTGNGTFSLGIRSWNESVTRTAQSFARQPFELWYKVINPDRVLKPL